MAKRVDIILWNTAASLTLGDGAKLLRVNVLETWLPSEVFDR
jgi:hypothetical protein